MPVPRSPGPGAPNAPAGGPVITGAAGGSGLDELHWKHWWSLEQETFLNLRDLPLRAALSGGGGEKRTRMALMPSREVIEADVLPALLQVLEQERDDSMISSALMAIARIGTGGERNARLSMQATVAIRERLGASSQEIKETAALALGILAEDRSLEPLIAIALGGDEGRRLVGKTQVATRTRSFAAFGLGLYALNRDEPAVRQRIAATLMEIIAEKHVRDDLPTAAVMAMGFCPAPRELTIPGKATRKSPFAQDVLSIEAQIRWILARLEDDSRRGAEALPRATRAHAATALGRLAQRASKESKANVTDWLSKLGRARTETIYVRTTGWMGLGLALNSGAGEPDRSGRALLENALDRGQTIEHHFAALALAQCSSTPGPVTDDSAASAWAGFEATRRALLRHVGRGRAASMPWFSLALGVQHWRMVRAEAPLDFTAARALRERVRLERNDAYIGAHALGCALTHEGAVQEERDRAGRTIYLAYLRTKDPEVRGELALALGLLEYQPALDNIKKLMLKSRFQPKLLWNCAVSLTLMRDRETVPLLIDTLKNARSSSSRAAAASALGRAGDHRAVEPLLELLADPGQPAAARSFAVVGLGLLCERTALPWRTPFAHAVPYFALTETLSGNKKGLLDIN